MAQEQWSVSGIGFRHWLPTIQAMTDFYEPLGSTLYEPLAFSAPL